MRTISHVTIVGTHQVKGRSDTFISEGGQVCPGTFSAFGQGDSVSFYDAVERPYQDKRSGHQDGTYTLRTGLVNVSELDFDGSYSLKQDYDETPLEDVVPGERYVFYAKGQIAEFQQEFILDATREDMMFTLSRKASVDDEVTILGKFQITGETRPHMVLAVGFGLVENEFIIVHDHSLDFSGYTRGDIQLEEYDGALEYPIPAGPDKSKGTRGLRPSIIPLDTMPRTTANTAYSRAASGTTVAFTIAVSLLSILLVGYVMYRAGKAF